jgi:hypothetical protein
MEDRVPVFEICRYFAFAAFLEHGTPSVGLASTIVWDCVLVSASIITVALSATKQMLKGKLRSVDGGSRWQSNTALSQRQLRGDLETQESARQASTRASIYAPSQIAEDMPPLPRPQPSSSSGPGLDENYDCHALRGTSSHASSDRILEAKPATWN